MIAGALQGELERRWSASQGARALATRDRAAVRVAPAPPAPIPKGLASEGLLAFIATAKFRDALPLYRTVRQSAWGLQPVICLT